MKTVLAPIDFSAVSKRVVERAISLARAMDARLVLLNVVPPIPVLGKNLALTVTGAEFAIAAEREAGKKLAKLQRALRDDGVTAHAVHVVGDPREGIVEQAERLNADYIVIGSHGHTAFYDLLVGSTATAVLKRSACPVVIVPPHAKDAADDEVRVAEATAVAGG